MNAAAKQHLKECEDRYPPRGTLKATIVERNDPVVYSQDKCNAPIAHHFIEQYQQQGFMVLDNVFSAPEV